MKKVTSITSVCVLLIILIPMTVMAGKKKKPPPQPTPVSEPVAKLTLSHSVATIGQLITADPAGSTAGTYVKQSKKPKKKQQIISGDPIQLTWGFDMDWTRVLQASGEVTGYFKTPGSHTVSLTVRDAMGKTNSISQTVQINNQYPTAKINISNSSPKLDERITVNLLGSDPDEKFGDAITQTLYILKETDQGRVQIGDPITSISFTKSFDTPGTYWLSLVVYDKYSGQGTAEAKIVVTNQLPVAVINGPTEKLTLESVTFKSGSHDPDTKGQITTSEWLIVDHQNTTIASANGNSITYTFPKPRTYIVLHRVVDQFGGENMTYQPFVALNRSPIANFGYTVSGQNYQFASTSRDDDGAIVGYEWRKNGQVVSNQPTISLSLTPGDYTIALSVVDDQGATASYQSVISTNALNPIARLNVSPTTTLSQTNLALDASASTDPNNSGGIVEYTFEDSDHNVIKTSNSKTTISYFTPGSRTVRVTVKSVFGTTNTSDQITVTITNRAPTVSVSASKDRELSLVKIRFTIFGIDQDGRIVRQWLIIKNGPTFEIPITNTDYDYAFPKPGVYKVFAKVEDDQGDTAVSNTLLLTVDNRRPSSGFTADKTTIQKGESVTVTSQANDQDGTIAKYDWQISDSRIFSGATGTVPFSQPGAFTITHTATDDYGDSTSSQMTIQVNDTPPPPRWPPNPIYLQQKLDQGSTPPNSDLWNGEKGYPFIISFMRLDKNGVIHTLPKYAQIDSKTGQIIREANIPNNGRLAVDDQGRVYFSSLNTNPAIVQVRDTTTLAIISEINVGKNGSVVTDIDRDGFLYVWTNNNAGESVMRVVDTTTLQLVKDEEGAIIEWKHSGFGSGVVAEGVNLWLNAANFVGISHIKRIGGQVTSIRMINNPSFDFTIGPRREIIYANRSSGKHSALNPEHLDDTAPIWPIINFDRLPTAICCRTISVNGAQVTYLPISFLGDDQAKSHIRVLTWK